MGTTTTDVTVTAPAVQAVKAVIVDNGQRVTVGWLAVDGHWWCDTCGRRPCHHVTAVRDHVTATIPAERAQR